jgi:hypothetical protein
MNYLSDKDFDLLPFQLGLLRTAENYQKWVLDAISPFLGENILEIGSGIGNMSRWLPIKEKLILSEVDSTLFLYLQKTVNQYFKMNKRVKILKVDLDKDWKTPLEAQSIDTIVSFNVMEHVSDDKLFFADLISILQKSKSKNVKRLITFVPAHNILFGSVDKYYGHFRRYTYSDLKNLKETVIPKAKFYYRYFNLIGMPGWFVLGRILKREQITKESVLYFEKLCPWVKPLDDFLHVKLRIPFGQSILCVVTL